MQSINGLHCVLQVFPVSQIRWHFDVLDILNFNCDCGHFANFQSFVGERNMRTPTLKEIFPDLVLLIGFEAGLQLLEQTCHNQI